MHIPPRPAGPGPAGDSETDPALPASASPPPSSFPGWIALLRREVLPALALAIAVVLIFAVAYDKLTWEALRIPVVYDSDGLAAIAIATGFAYEDGVSLLGPKDPEHLGAPFTGNWNDYPQIEDVLFWFWGGLIRIFGTGLGMNLALFLAHVANGLGAYAALRWLGVPRWTAAAAGLLFGVSFYSFARSMGHITLTVCPHVPFAVALPLRASQEDRFLLSRFRLTAFLFFSLLTGLLNPYYSFLFCQFLFLLFLYKLWQRHPDAWRWALGPLAVFLAALLMVSDSLFSRWRDGPNPGALTRNFDSLLIYALHLPDLFLPHLHTFKPWQHFAIRNYYAQGGWLLGEASMAYIGLVGLAGFGLLFWRGFLAPPHPSRGLHRTALAGVSWTLAYALAGGLNLFLGIGGLLLFRGTNRFSIFLYAFALIAVALFIRDRRTAAQRALWCAILVVVGVWDQISTTQMGIFRQYNPIYREAFLSDEAFGRELDARLQPGDMVHLMPAMDFPEVPPIHQLPDYDPFRTYLFCRDAHFSYGSHKGRPRDSWKMGVEFLRGAELTSTLEQMGFAGLVVHRLGYPDGGAAVLESLQAHLPPGSLFSSPAGDKVFVALQPSPHPGNLITLLYGPEFTGFERDETATWSWACRSSATLSLINPDNREKTAHLEFFLEAMAVGQFEFLLNDTVLHTVPADIRFQVELDSLILRPGLNTFTIRSTVEPTLPASNDPRQLTFRIMNCRVRETQSAAAPN